MDRLDRIDRMLREAREREKRVEIPALRILALATLGIVLACMVVVLFLVMPAPGALAVVGVGAVMGWPCFHLGRRHAQWLGRVTRGVTETRLDRINNRDIHWERSNP